MVVNDKAMIVALIREHEDRIRAMGVKRLGLFGSFARGEQDAESDIDVLVEFEPGKKTFDNFMQLSFFLEDLLQRRVELVTPDSIGRFLRPSIMKEVEYVPLRNPKSHKEGVT